jgi:hypothetical protein
MLFWEFVRCSLFIRSLFSPYRRCVKTILGFSP